MFNFDPRKSFFQLPILWITVSIVLLICSLISGVIVYHTHLEWDLSGDGFNHFVQTFKVPLGLSALLIPGIALLASNHRSVQTRAQIVAAESQNNFSNYYKHLEEFEKYAGNHLAHGDRGSVLNNVRQTHKILFPNAIKGAFQVNSELMAAIDQLAGELVLLIEQAATQLKADESIQLLVDIDLNLQRLEETVGINIYWARRGGKKIKLGDGREVTSPDGKYRSFFAITHARVSKVFAVLEFDIETAVPSNLLSLLRIDTANVPETNIDTITPPAPFNPFATP